MLRSTMTRRLLPVALVAGVLPLAAGAADSKSTAAPAVRYRTFRFTYAGTVTGLPPGKAARIWLPVAPSNEDQQVKMLSKDLPGPYQINREPRFGNQILFMEAKADAKGDIPYSVTYRVGRREATAEVGKLEEGKKLTLFLQPDAKVPIGGKPLELIKDQKLPNDQLAAARVLYDVVNRHMQYKKEGTGWGRGDAVWACENGYGNCTDFHSLFISLARSQKIPAKFEIGFPIPAEGGAGAVPGYHCWAFFQAAGKGWVPVDISEANKNPKLRDYYFGHLSEDRVAFSTGRDLELVPKQAGEPLNFFVYPYVEVDGKPYAADKIKNQFSYKDLPAEGT